MTAAVVEGPGLEDVLGAIAAWEAECALFPHESPIRLRETRAVAFVAMLAYCRSQGWRPIAELGPWVPGDEARELLCYCVYQDEPPQFLILDSFEVHEYKQVTHYRDLPAPPSAGEPS